MVCVNLLAVATLAVFAWERPVLDMRTGALALVSLIASGTAFLGWMRSPQGDLRWDGQQWLWSGFAETAPCRLALVLDFQRVMVVKITTGAHVPEFLWLEANPGDTSWRPLRRAIVSSQAASVGKAKKAGPGVAGEFA
ncbi:MAG: hypothetical protein V4627_01070 [Pseudomonadota bacterium]